MIAAPVVRTAGRGRQPAAVEAQRDLELELVAERAEGLIFARRVLAAGEFLAGGPRPPHAVISLGGELAYYATRRIRQAGGIL